MGAAGSLLVFTGVWHAFEWAMHGRNRDTARLVPVGILYALMGWFIVTGQFMPWIAWMALVLTSIGLVAALSMRRTAAIPKWVLWSFIIVDALIIAGLLSGLAL